jgi:hypothetical protein
MIEKGLPCVTEQTGNSAQEFDPLMSALRTASIRNFGSSTPKRRAGSPLSPELPLGVTIRCARRQQCQYSFVAICVGSLIKSVG